jgi:crotonobetainyl-CoA:carnitine CoA-transferase CaiB-like acyl-CoA transferase
MNHQALSDVRVLDLTWHIAGPYCTKLLADYGADVVKVERPGLGDPSRRMGPFPQDQPHPEKSGLFLHLNTNKKGITLNLKRETGREIFMRLVCEADVVVESFAPRVMPSLGLGFPALHAANPKLVMLCISNFGQTGPYRDFRLSELVLSAMGTSMKTCGQPDREPLKLAGNLLQYQAGVVAATAGMGAFLLSRATGTGQQVDVSLMETCLGSIDRRAPSLLGHQFTGDVSTRIGSGRGGTMSGCPEGVYPCRDGYFDVVGGAAWWPRNFAMMGSPASLADPAYGTMDGQMDPRRQQDILTALYTWAMAHTKQEVWEASGKARAAAAPLYDIKEVVNDPHFKERGTFVEIDHVKAGRLRYPGASFRPMETPWRVNRPAPLLGEHNQEVYGKLGYTAEDLAKLREADVI